MICVECMHEKQEHEYAGLFFQPNSTAPLFCVCKNCSGKETEYPTLKSIH